MRIVVIQTAFLGDVVLTTPLLRELRRSHPGASIAVVATPVGVETLSGLRHVSERIVLDKRRGVSGAAATWRLARRLRQAAPDVVIAAQRSARTGLLARASRAPLRIGFAGAAGAWACNRRVKWVGTDHAVHRYLALARPAGGDPDSADPRPELAVAAEARERAEGLLAAERIGPDDSVLAVAPGSIWATKRWTAEGYAEVLRWGAARGYRTVLVGSADETALCTEIAGRAAAGSAVLAGRTTIPVLVALLARARALVTNDSGPGHVAAAVGTPVVAIFGPTVPAFGYAPFGESARTVGHPDLACRPCDRHGPAECPLEHHRCMRDLRAGPVLDRLSELLG